MLSLVAGQYAGITAAVVRDRSTVIPAYYVRIEIHEPFAGDTGRNRTHTMRGMADRAGESVLRDVIAMLQETGVGYHFAQTVTLGAHAIRSAEAEVRIREKIRDQSSRGCGLTELIVVLEDVGVG